MFSHLVRAHEKFNNLKHVLNIFVAQSAERKLWFSLMVWNAQVPSAAAICRSSELSMEKYVVRLLLPASAFKTFVCLSVAKCFLMSASPREEILKIPLHFEHRKSLLDVVVLKNGYFVYFILHNTAKKLSDEDFIFDERNDYNYDAPLHESSAPNERFRGAQRRDAIASYLSSQT